MINNVVAFTLSGSHLLSPTGRKLAEGHLSPVSSLGSCYYHQSIISRDSSWRRSSFLPVGCISHSQICHDSQPHPTLWYGSRPEDRERPFSLITPCASGGGFGVAPTSHNNNNNNDDNNNNTVDHRSPSKTSKKRGQQSPRQRKPSSGPARTSAKTPAASAKHVQVVRNAVWKHGAEIVASLKAREYALIDGFLGEEAARAMRLESMTLYDQTWPAKEKEEDKKPEEEPKDKSGGFQLAESTRWNAETKSIETYHKTNVFSMQIQGGVDQYDKVPRLVEYIVTLTQHLPLHINQGFPEVDLSSKFQTNKLAVCAGPGAKYDKHYDNMGSGDLRKLTVLYYMNESWKPEYGGQFRMYDKKDPQKYQDIEPFHDRLLLFWSDSNVHEVLPFLGQGREQYRYALTVWLLTDNVKCLEADPEIERIHFPEVQGDQVKKLYG